MAPENAAWPDLLQLTIDICTACLGGAEGECHSPGCLFWMGPAPTAEQAARIDGWAKEQAPASLCLREVETTCGTYSDRAILANTRVLCLRQLPCANPNHKRERPPYGTY